MIALSWRAVYTNPMLKTLNRNSENRRLLGVFRMKMKRFLTWISINPHVCNCDSMYPRKTKKNYMELKEMFTMLNKINLMGRLTADPILRHTNTTGTPVASFAIAVDRRRVQGREKETDFFNVVAWDTTGEFVTNNFTKGQPICVAGRLQQRIWTDNQGNTRYAYEVVAESVYFAGFKREDAQNGVVHDIGEGNYNAGFDPFENEAAA